MRNFYILILLLLSSLNLFSKEVNLQLSWKHQFQFAGYYMAKEKGFYNAYDIDVNFLEFDMTQNATNDVLENKTDFAVGRSSLILEYLKGKQLLLLNAVFQETPLVLVAQKEFKNLHKLKHKRIMALDSTSMASIHAMLKSTGIRRNEFISKDHTFKISDFIEKKADAMVGYVANEPYILDQKGVEYNLFSPHDFDFDFYSDILFTSKELFKNDALLVQNFNQASLAGWKYAFDNIEETVEVILKKYNTQNKSREALLYEARALKKLAYKKDIVLGNIDKNRIKQIAQVYRLLGLTQQVNDFENFIYEAKPFYIDLSIEEREFLMHQPTIKVHNEMAWAPFNFNESNRPRGYSIDYMNLLAKVAGLKVEYVSGPTWNEFIEQIKNKKLDVMLNMSNSEERKQFIDFTDEPYLRLSPSLFMRKGEKQVSHISDLYGKTVAIPKGFYLESYLKKHPQVNILYVNDTLAAIKAVSNKEADVVIDLASVVHYYKNKHAIKNIEIGGNIFLSKKSIPISIGVRKELSQLTSILNKAAMHVDEEDLIEIETKWLFNAPDKKINLSNKELDWIKEHTIVNVSFDPYWLPIEGLDENKKHPVGMVMEYMKLISEMTGLKFHFIKTADWEEAVENVKVHKKAQMFSAVHMTEERKTYLNFSKPFYKKKNVLVTQHDHAFLTSITQLESKKIGVVKGYASAMQLRKKYPHLNYVEVNNSLEGLKQLSNGKLDAFVGSMAVTRYLINTYGLFSLKVALKLEEEQDIHFAVHKEINPILVSILNKAILLISDEKKEQIINHWTTVKVEETTDYKLLWQMGLSLLAIILLILLWNRRLRLAVEEKTQKLTKLLDTFDENVIASKTDQQGIITYASHAFCLATGYSKEELIGQPHNIIRHPDMPSEAFEVMWKTIQKGKVWRGEVKNRKKDGGYYWVDAIIEPIYEHNAIVGYSAIRHDITAQKKLEELSTTLQEQVQDEVQKNKEKDMKLFAQSKMASMGEMIGNIAHQWRQPLSAISTLASGIKLQNEFGVLNTKDLSNDMGNIVDKAQYLSKTIDTFMDFAKETKEFENCGIKQMIESPISLLKSSFQNHHVNVQTNFDTFDEFEIYTIPIELEQVVMNILNNSKDALKECDDSNKSITITVEQKDHKAYICIEDNAGGIPEDIIDRIFEPYFTTKHQSQGTGLGLHIVYRIIVESLKGQIAVRNTEHGALFTIELPMT